MLIFLTSFPKPHALVRTPDFHDLQELPESIRAMKNNIERTGKGLATQQKSVMELVNIVLKVRALGVTSAAYIVTTLPRFPPITQARETLSQEIEKGLSLTLPAHSGAQSSQVELLGATIEASLVKLALGRARAEHALYSQTMNEDVTKSMVQALETALNALKTEEKAKKIELCRLDKDLREYEAVLELVDCGHEGYQQVVNDWTKVQEDTDECLKDLRRLGWTGD